MGLISIRFFTSLYVFTYIITGEGRKLSGETLNFRRKQIFFISIVSLNQATQFQVLPHLHFFYFNRHNNKVCHYRIQQNQNSEFYIDDNINFRSLEELIDFYKQSQGGISCKSYGASWVYMHFGFNIGLCTKLCEYTQTGPGSIKHQSSLTGKIVDWDNNYYSFTLNPSFVIDAMWEIPKSELRHGTEIAKGRCGVSIL